MVELEKLQSYEPALVIGILTVFVTLIPQNPLSSTLKLQLLISTVFVLILYSLWISKQGNKVLDKSMFYYLITTAVLLLVATTGWFFSPFYFLLYLVGIMLAFVFEPLVSTVFIGILVIFFSFDIGEVDVVYDFLVVLSLVPVIPLSYYLRGEYLTLKEAAKEIMVLEDEQAGDLGAVESLLSNRVNKMAAELRESISDIKHIAQHMEEQSDEPELQKHTESIIVSARKALDLLNEFEEDATGKKVISTKLSDE